MSDKKLAELASIAPHLEKDSFEQLVAYAAIGEILVSSFYDVRNFSKVASRALEISIVENEDAA